ncbi:uncharacterized protein ARMOST_20482 [Armillaria ostoyae]|uniref:Uncharacterized protein n=1 Tax=Armillaria ostoyae TaxID=47428 RepID=A0A284S7K3_ARMOS|nr:uncharacterized protein ARMOST_20482 [Armillaria ostoyae]
MGFRKALVKRWKNWVGTRKDDIYVCEEEEQTKHEYRRPVDTLSTIAVDDQHDSSIPPPKQHSSTCDRSIVLSGLADVPCPDLGIDIDAMLEKFDDSATPAMSHNLEKEQANQANRVPEATLIPIDKNAQQDSNIPALNRQSSTRGTPTMPSGPADVPCAGLGIDAMLEEIDDSAIQSVAYNHEEEQENRLPEDILSVVAENGQHDSRISQLEQHSSTGGTPVIPSSLEDLPFTDLHDDILLEGFNDSATPSISHNFEEDRIIVSQLTNQAYRFPDGTLSAFTETGRPESSIPVLKQRSYTGNKCVIPSALASALCTDLGIDAVFEMLNAILGTSHKPTTSVGSVLAFYIARNYDFGTVYGRLRWYWQYSFACIDIHT